MIFKVDEELHEIIAHFNQRQKELNTILFKVIGRYCGVPEEDIPHLVLVRSPEGAVLFDDRTHKVEGETIVRIEAAPIPDELEPPELSPNEVPQQELEGLEPEGVPKNFMRPSKVSYKKKEQ